MEIRNLKSGRSNFVLVAIVAVAILTGLAGWYFYRRHSRIAGIRNVVLISIDTCRADHLSCYGYQRPTTPNIDAVARDGVLFQQALTPVPLTTSAHSSMLTGTYPPTHGVRLNNGERLADSNVTLAEILRDAGYQTAAFVGGFPLDSQFGLNQGFDTYDCQFTRKNDKSKHVAERTAEEVSRPALAWLEKQTGKPFFLFLHYFDAHLPYTPPLPYALTYADAPYAGEIAYVDHWIGQVLDRLRELGMYDNTLVIITGDHGEGLGEHGEHTHGLLIYQSTLRVPLIIRAPHGRKGRRLDGNVSLVDIVPTVLNLTGLKTPTQVEGVNLRPCLEGGAVPSRKRPIYCESLEAATFGCSPLQGVVEDSSKYIRAPKQELYDLKRDSDELNNAIETAPQVARRLRGSLETMLPQMEAAAPRRGRSTVDPEALKRLQSLGYVGGGATPAASTFDTKLEDPKDFLLTYERLQKAHALFLSNQGEEAEKELLEIIKSRPNLITAQAMLAEIAMKERRLDKAAERCAAIVTILAVAPDASPQLSLETTNLRTGILDTKDLATAHFNLAVVLKELGKTGEAIDHFEDALRIRPDFAEARFNLGLLLAQTGKLPEAISHYTEAVHLSPDFLLALNNLAWIRATNADPKLRDGAEAVRLAEHACELTERKSVGVLDTLAAAYAEAQRFPEAVTTAELAAKLARDQSNLQAATAIEARLQFYRAGQPYRESVKSEKGS